MRSSAGSSEFRPCPHCGESVANDAGFCPECGSDEECGWNEDDSFDSDDGLYADDDDFDYDSFVAREFPDHADQSTRLDSRQRWVAFVILAIIVSLLVTTVSF